LDLTQFHLSQFKLSSSLKLCLATKHDPTNERGTKFQTSLVCLVNVICHMVIFFFICPSQELHSWTKQTFICVKDLNFMFLNYPSLKSQKILSHKIFNPLLNLSWWKFHVCICCKSAHMNTMKLLLDNQEQNMPFTRFEFFWLMAILMPMFPLVI
jgi:hypothetical protein